ncbi:MAG TPA: lipoyl(octanoyl) transferase LipB [Candidatus Kapabacteria bacterium]|nr:lipoyl(octanoyl) transferase LipB [Candidatus Kapabacteria bacterium]
MLRCARNDSIKFFHSTMNEAATENNLAIKEESRPIVTLHDLGTIRFAEAWEKQRLLHAHIVNQKKTSPANTDNYLLLLEHSHVYTLGKVTERSNLLFDDAKLKSIGAEQFEIDRGGDVTYHGPGQLVGYPILNLTMWKEDLHWFLRMIEETIIRSLKHFSLEGYRVEGRTGVWVGDEKVCAIGIKCSHWVTMHGFAWNINTDLSYFNNIIPCGIQDKGVTSLEKLLGRKVDMQEVKGIYAEEFGNVFGCGVDS